MTVECPKTSIPHTPVLRDYPERSTGKNIRDDAGKNGLEC